VVGIEDHFYNLMIYQLSFGLLAPVFDGGPARLQPTWVRDVSEATFNILKHGDTKGKTLYLAGPETLT
jgi:NADH dehydrogenase (ubiquinone) 1 alpha subcomplex subunit 9